MFKFYFIALWKVLLIPRRRCATIGDAAVTADVFFLALLSIISDFDYINPNITFKDAPWP